MNDIEYKVTRPFLKMLPIINFSWQDLVTSIQTGKLNQNQFMEATIFHSQVKKFPLSDQYVKEFLKQFIETLEANEIEVHENIYLKYLDLLSCKNNREDFYRTYYITNMKIILKEMGKLIVDGTTGLITWQASRILAEYCLENLDLFKLKDILELGAGLGLTGISLVKSVPLNSYTFTDHHPKVLDFLRNNIDLNLSLKGDSSNEGSESSNKWQKTDVKVEYLDWEISEPLQKYDIVLAADVVFDTRVIPYLINIVSNSLKKGGKAIFASTVRNLETYNNYFLRELEERAKIECTEERTYQEPILQDISSKVQIITFYVNENEDK